MKNFIITSLKSFCYGVLSSIGTLIGLILIDIAYCHTDVTKKEGEMNIKFYK